MTRCSHTNDPLPLPIPQEIRNEVAAYLDPFSLANAVRSGRLPHESTPRALFGGIWTALLSLKGIEELKEGLTEQGNAILVGNGLDRLYDLCLHGDGHRPRAPTYIILTWVYAKENMPIKEGRLQIPQYNIVLLIKKPDMMFDTNGITVDNLDNFIDNKGQTKILRLKDEKFTIRLVTMQSRKRNHTRPVPFQFWFNLETPFFILCLQSWQRPKSILSSLATIESTSS